MAGFSENTHLSVVLNRRRALTLLPLPPDTSHQTESPYKIPHSSAENGCTKVHWSQFACGSSPKTSVHRNGTSSTNHTQHPELWGPTRRELRLVLNDVLKTEIGRRYLQQNGCDQPSARESEKSRRESHTPKRRTRRVDLQLRPLDSPKPKPLHSSLSTLTVTHQPKHVHTSQSRPIGIDLPKPISPLLLQADHSEQLKPVTTPKARHGSSETSRLVDSIRRKTPIVDLDLVTNLNPPYLVDFKSRPVSLDALKSINSLKPKPVRREMPGPLTSPKSNSVSSQTPRSIFNSSKVRQVQSDSPRPLNSLKLGRTTTDQPKYAECSKSKPLCSETTRSGSSFGSIQVPPGPPTPRGSAEASRVNRSELPRAKDSPRENRSELPRAKDSPRENRSELPRAKDSPRENRSELPRAKDSPRENRSELPRAKDSPRENRSELPRPCQGGSKAPTLAAAAKACSEGRDQRRGSQEREASHQVSPVEQPETCTDARRQRRGSRGREAFCTLSPAGKPESCGESRPDRRSSQEREASCPVSPARTPAERHKSRLVISEQLSAAEHKQWEDVSRKRSGGNGVLRKEESKNGVMKERECAPRKSVLCLSGESGVVGGAEEPPIKCPRLESPAGEQTANEERPSLIRTPSHSSQSEPIVLSSEEEGDDEDEACGDSGADVATCGGDEDEDDDEDDGGDDDDGEHDEEEDAFPGPSARQEDALTDTQDTHILDTFTEDPDLNGVDLSHLPSIELSFSTFYMGGVTAQACGKVEITDETITFPLKDSSGAGVEVVMATANLCTYSLLQGDELHNSGLVQRGKAPPPSLLFLWVSQNQAQELHKDLSVIQPGTRPVESSVCVCVSLHESVWRVEQALLASIMDIVGMRYRKNRLLSPLSLAECLQVMHTSGDTHLLQVLRPVDSLQPTHTSGDTHLLQVLRPADSSLQPTHTSGDTHLLQVLRPADSSLQPTHTSGDTHPHEVPKPAVTHTPGDAAGQLEPQTQDDDDNTSTEPSTPAQEEPEQMYTLQHSCHQGRYSVCVAKPGPEWMPYKHQGPARRLIQFPPPPCKGAITVTIEDLECLDSGQFLNDVIIDFYLKYLMVEKTPQELVEKCHVFSSFFYKQLTRRDNANEDSTSTTAEHRRHQRVKTWTRNVDIFSKDFLFVPVNQESHWYLVVICFPGLEVPQYEAFYGPAVVRAPGDEGSGESQAQLPAQEASPDTPGSSEADRETKDTIVEPSPSPPDCTEKTCTRPTVCKRPCILIMDSLKLSIHKRVVKLLREYLQVEWEVRRGASRDFSPEVMMGSSCKVPLQDNSSDCGLYLLHYAETFLQDPVVHFDLPLRLERWFPRQQVRRKRDEIRNQVLRLCRFQSGMMGNVVLQGSTAAQ